MEGIGGMNYEVVLDRLYTSLGVKLEDSISYKTYEANDFLEVVLVKEGSKQTELHVFIKEDVIDCLVNEDYVLGEDIIQVLIYCEYMRNNLLKGNLLLVKYLNKEIEGKLGVMLYNHSIGEIVKVVSKTVKDKLIRR